MNIFAIIFVYLDWNECEKFLVFFLFKISVNEVFKKNDWTLKKKLLTNFFSLSLLSLIQKMYYFYKFNFLQKMSMNPSRILLSQNPLKNHQKHQPLRHFPCANAIIVVRIFCGTEKTWRQLEWSKKPLFAPSSPKSASFQRRGCLEKVFFAIRNGLAWFLQLFLPFGCIHERISVKCHWELFREAWNVVRFLLQKLKRN